MTRRNLVLPASGSLTSAGESLVEVNLGDLEPSRFYCELALLNEGKAEGLLVRQHVGGLRVDIAKEDIPVRARCAWKEQSLKVMLSQAELEYWMSFFLKYYRDGVAEVDHLDVEADSARGEVVDIIVKVSQAAPPVTDAEARRRLGLTGTRFKS